MYRSRYRQILRFFFRLISHFVWWDVVLPRVGFRFLSRSTRSKRMKRAATAFRGLAVRMGGVLIKVGQFLSARLDVMPAEIIAELSGLQDEVGAESFDDIRAVIEAEFARPLNEIFLELEEEPLASASIGQVHRARLLPEAATKAGSDHQVVVKVQRPKIHQIVEADLAALRVVGGWLGRFPFITRHANVRGLIEEFSRVMYEEMDYEHEGRNAETFAHNFRGRKDIKVPHVVWSCTTARVLTLEDVGAIKITDYAAIDAAGIDRGQVAARLLETYLKQIFEDGFFHADPHPGNLFVLPAPTQRNSAAWKLVFVDFGMTGTLPQGTFTGLREGLIAIGTRDAARLVGAYQKLNLLLPGADLELLERANSRVFDSLWGKSVKSVMEMDSSEVTKFIDEFRGLLYELPFQIPENLILLGRCIAILSGLAVGLQPEFNVWEVIAPYAQTLIKAEGGSRTDTIIKEVMEVGRTLFALPKRIDSFISRIEQGRLDVRMPEMRQHVQKLESGFRKLAGSIIFSTVLLCATVFTIAGRLEIAIAMGAVDLCLLGWILFGR